MTSILFCSAMRSSILSIHQVTETFGLPATLSDKLRVLHIPQQQDPWSCGPRFAWTVRQRFAFGRAEVVNESFIQAFAVDSSLDFMASMVQDVIQATIPF